MESTIQETMSYLWIMFTLKIIHDDYPLILPIILLIQSIIPDSHPMDMVFL